MLIIDDEKDICALLSISLTRMGVDTDTVGSLAEAFNILNSNKYDFCMTDMRLPDGEGLQIVEHITKTYPKLPVAVLTAHANMNNAIAALKAGAFDYLAKPISRNQLQDLLNVAFSAIEIQEQFPQNKVENKSATSNNGGVLNTFIGNSEIINNLKTLIKKLGASNVPVFINGESGSGKELVARAIHKLSGRANKPFIAVNCGAIPEALTESEFFGYRKGSFTGANNDREGLFQAANGGSLFLDEIADLPPLMQVKLLRAIQEKSIRRVGDTTEITVDVRIISATHKDLFKLIEKGDFRQDLYYRINVLEVIVPPLREHIEDIAEISQHIIQKKAPRMSLSPAAIEKLKNYSYPGNVRELENVLERAVAVSNGNIITPEDLWFKPNASNDSKSIDIKEEFANSIRNSAISNNQPLILDELLETVKGQIILKALANSNQDINITAQLLGLSYDEVEVYIKKHQVLTP